MDDGAMDDPDLPPDLAGRLADAERRFALTFERAPIGMALVAVDRRILRVNAALCRILGRSEDALLARTVRDITHPADIDADEAHMRRLLDGEVDEYRVQKRYLRGDGSTVACQLDVTLVRDVDGAPDHMIAQVQDITEHREVIEALERAAAADRRAHEQARLDNARLEAFLERSADVIIVSDGEGLITYASPGADLLFGSPMRVGRTLPDGIVHPDDRSEVLASYRQLLSSPGATVRSVQRIRHGDGWRHLEVVATNRLADEAVGGIVANVRDITERAAAAARLEWQAYHDGLTGLANRVFLMRRMETMIEAARERGERVAVLFLDLDRFKLVNDERGHDAGDQLLVETARRLTRSVRGTDEVARLGGDEFVVVTGGGADDDVRSLADRIRDSLSMPVAIGGAMVAVSTSIGVAYDSGQSPDRLLRDADAALRRAKERGKNRIEVFNEALRVAAQRRIAVEANLRRVLDDRHLVVHHQPIIALDDGRLVGAEALVRVPTADGRLELPGEYVSLAEDLGLIGVLGEAVLDATCQALAGWRGDVTGHDVRLVAVNVSARQLGSALFATRLEEVVSRHGLRPGDIALEITESTVIGADRTTVRTVDALQEMGVALWLDDFGTGYSSLAYLKRFPIEAVKLDHSFVAGLGTDHGDTEIVRAIIALGRALDLRVVAEGVETPSQLETLRKLGCPCAQGYLLGAPGPSDELDARPRDLAALSGSTSPPSPGAALPR